MLTLAAALIVLALTMLAQLGWAHCRCRSAGLALGRASGAPRLHLGPAHDVHPGETSMTAVPVSMPGSFGRLRLIIAALTVLAAASLLLAWTLATSDRPTTAVVWGNLALAALAFGLLCIRAGTAGRTSWALLRTHLVAGKQAGLVPTILEVRDMYLD